MPVAQPGDTGLALQHTRQNQLRCRDARSHDHRELPAQLEVMLRPQSGRLEMLPPLSCCCKAALQGQALQRTLQVSTQTEEQRCCGLYVPARDHNVQPMQELPELRVPLHRRGKALWGGRQMSKFRPSTALPWGMGRARSAGS